MGEIDIECVLKKKERVNETRALDSLLETHPSHASGTLGHTLFAHFLHLICDECSGSPRCDVLVVEQILGKKGVPGRRGVWLPAWAFCLCITDVYLSAAFAYYSLQTRKKAVDHRLDYMLSRLASLAVTTCIPPAIVSAVMAILQIIKPSGRSWNFFTVILGALYTVCILHALNARHQILSEARSRSTMKNTSPSVTGCKDPSSSSSNGAKKLALRLKKNEEDQTFSGTESAKQIYSTITRYETQRPLLTPCTINLRGVQDGATQYVAAHGAPPPPGLGCWMRHWWSPEPGRMDAMDLTAPKFRTLEPRRQVTSGNRSG
ncbi:BQ5605_C017g08475 [Microbotryum silenes-dioicae]|uniref:BQ5605_C017g08475 protein n=1 Tax=Microbotryum silenes-dioicae TaxID=796604 RepID=A0A2X0LYS6_9BASI|nr:BQ5605_C017g08475 [Microbotryum silenes-dioicae]